MSFILQTLTTIVCIFLALVCCTAATQLPHPLDKIGAGLALCALLAIWSAITQLLWDQAVQTTPDLETEATQ
ncbi:hypothetical protein [Jeongeupia sp. USM3]|uniref:hypothetical protein n=1 Tax=Jeongeupia sp. USM3 TaxID=1906741 RepID=UPI00089DE17B|nr:hypothetical protein [Jeongeupia sp. USM3]AOY00126.1 hypothetical protein BJP62_06470 [Jeongeupia sp. USM3]